MINSQITLIVSVLIFGQLAWTSTSSKGFLTDANRKFLFSNQVSISNTEKLSELAKNEFNVQDDSGFIVESFCKKISGTKKVECKFIRIRN